MNWLIIIYVVATGHVLTTQAPRGESGYVSAEACGWFGQAIINATKGVTYRCVPVERREPAAG